ncbi:MAG: hypothetical protein FWE58_03385 [Methanobrevibacter sp.]|nr:hypothetical protein [Methanobrevibacter sp.]
MRYIIIGIIAGAIVGFITKSVLTTLITGIVILIICFIGSRLLNPEKYIFNNMVLEARKTTDKVLAKINQQCYDKNILIRYYSEIAGIDLLKLPKSVQDGIEKYLTCIEGLCYIIGLNHSKFPSNSMVMRCIQFITFIDKSLYGYGIMPCSFEKKISLYKTANLYEAYLHDPSAFYTSDNEKEEVMPFNNIIYEYQNSNQMPDENKKTEEKKIVTIKARKNIQPSDCNVIDIYNELINSKNSTFEYIFNKFQNIQCLNDVVLYENLEYIDTSSYSTTVSHYVDNNGESYISYFSYLPNKAIDFLLFQLTLEFFSGIFYYNSLVTKLNDIQNYKVKLKRLLPASNHSFLYGTYPYYYEKDNVPYIQAFFAGIGGEVLFVDICILNGKEYEIKNTTVIQVATILF